MNRYKTQDSKPKTQVSKYYACRLALVFWFLYLGLAAAQELEPRAEHDETAWGLRLHLPMQFINGAVARASRVDVPVLGDRP